MKFQIKHTNRDEKFLHEFKLFRVFYPCDIFLTMVMNKLKTFNNEK